MKTEEAAIWEHELLVAKALEEGRIGSLTSHDDIVHIGHGRQKYVFKINGECLREYRVKGDVLAVATPYVENQETFPLETEFDLLATIHEAITNVHTPEPIAYVRTKSAKLLLMEYIPFPEIGAVKGQFSDASMSYLLGNAAGMIYAETGLCHQEPHDRNILVGPAGEIKFVDAIHYKKGSIDDLFTPFYKDFAHDRSEVNRHKDDFKQGVYDAGGFKNVHKNASPGAR